MESTMDSSYLNVQLSDADGGLVLCISGSDWNAQKKKPMELCCDAYITWRNDLACIPGKQIQSIAYALWV